ncbi:MAG: S41 family peptidase [Nibricoccus sp.]
MTTLFAATPEEIAKGDAMLMTKKFDDALEFFGKMLQAEPSNIEALVGRGRAHFGKHEYDLALADYNEVLRLDPKFTDALWARSRYFSARGDYKQALADADALIKLEPKSAFNYRARARLYRRLKDYAKALDDANRAIQLDQKDPASYEVRASILSKAESFREAIADYSQMISMDAKSAGAYLDRGGAYAQIGSFKEALADYEQAIRLKPEDDLCLNDYAWVLATCSASEYHDGPRAITLATKACEISRWQDDTRLDTLAAAYARAGDFEKAVLWQTKAVELNKDPDEARGCSDRLALYKKHEAYAQSSPDKEKVAWSLLRSETFDVVWTTVYENYFDTTFGGVDWRAMREKYRLRLWAAEDKRALARLLQEMLNELKRTHFAIIPRDMAVLAPEERGRIGCSGATVSVIEKEITVVRVKPGSPAEKAGVRPGDVVRGIAKRPLAEVLAMISENVASPEKRLAYLRGFVSYWLTAPVGREVDLSLESLDGSLREVKLITVEHDGTWSEPMGATPSEPLESEVQRSANGVVYLRFNLFALPTMNEFKRVVKGLQPGESLLLDLRGNSGGLTAMAAGITGRLITQEQSLGTLNRRYGKEDFLAYPQRGAFGGGVAVLVDSASASTSEILAAGLRDIGRARVFGETTAGAALPSLFRKLPTGDMFQYAIADIKTPKGLLIEGNGVKPDELVSLQRADCAAGRDVVREAAEQWLINQTASSRSQEASR